MSHAEPGAWDETPKRVARFLRALATRVEQDATLATHIAACLRESGLLVDGAVERDAATPPRNRQRRADGGASASRPPNQDSTLDPFALWRASGEDALRQRLGELSLPELRTIVRAHRLDPARVSSRWTAGERVAALILEQVRARMRHGRAFERI